MRPRFLRCLPRLGLPALLGVAALVAWLNTNGVRRGLRTLRGLPLAREYRVLHVSDLHNKRFGRGQARIERLLAGRVYDLVFLTGDVEVVAGDELSPAVELVEVLRRHTPNVLFVAGNHDDARVVDAMREAGAQILDDGIKLVSHDAHGKPDLVILGRHGTDPFSFPPESADAALTIIASHTPPQPEEADALARSEGPPLLVLSGHTHGGQIRLPLLGTIWAAYAWFTTMLPPEAGLFFPDLRHRFIRGLYRQSRLMVHASPGLGTTIVPVRFLAPAEVTEIRLLPRTD